MRPAILALENGSYFLGQSFGADGTSVGELVFNTSMTGYQEVLTDPSYRGQVVMMTYPLIGNYGINTDDVESHQAWLAGFVVREYQATYSNWRATASLGDWLRERGVVAITGVDTRAITRGIREKGAMQSILSTETTDVAALFTRMKEAPTIVGRDLVREVTCQMPYTWPRSGAPVQTERPEKHVVAYDFGIKQNILRMLTRLGCRVTVVPADTSADDVRRMNPNGVLLSNGPGDPEALSYAIKNCQQLIGTMPIFGICLGHQILGLALGGKCFKLKFGHHGGNHPVMTVNKTVQITAQNHGFAIDVSPIAHDVDITHINLNDETVEGMRHRRLPIFSVQFHPEASPGPHDTEDLFRDFIRSMGT